MAECQDVVAKMQFDFEACPGCHNKKCWNRLDLDEAGTLPEGDNHVSDGEFDSISQTGPGSESADERSKVFQMSPTRAAALFENMF